MKSKFSLLASERHNFLAAAVGGIAVQHFQGYKEDVRQWHDGFSSGMNELLERQKAELHTTMDQARNAGVDNRWDFEQFFAQSGYGNGVLGYHDTDGFHPWGPDDLDQIIKGSRVQINGDTVEGHHINSISAKPDDFASATDPDNIKFVTREAHLHEHGGNFQNPTTGEADEVTNLAERILDNTKVDKKLDAYLDSIDDLLIASSISSALNLLVLKNDPRPWRQKVFISLSDGLMNTGISSVLYVASFELQEFILESISDFSSDIAGSAFESILESTGTMGMMVLARAGSQVAMAYYKGTKVDSELIGNALISASKTVAISGAAILCGLDPTGVLLVFTLVKIGWNFFENSLLEDDFKKYEQIVLVSKYDRACQALTIPQLPLVA